VPEGQDGVRYKKKASAVNWMPFAIESLKKFFGIGDPGEGRLLLIFN